MGAPEQELQIHPGTSFGSMGFRNRIHPVARGQFIDKAARKEAASSFAEQFSSSAVEVF